VAAAAAVSAEKAAPVPARRPHATRAKLRIKTLEHKPQQLQKPEQLDRPSIPTEATSATNFPRLAMRHSLAPPLGMWSAAAGQTMPPTLGRSYQARVVFSCVAVLQTKMMMLLVEPPMLLGMQSCRVEARVKAPAAFCSVPPAMALQPTMMSMLMVLPMALQPKMMPLLNESRVAALQPKMRSLLMALPMLRTQSRVETASVSVGCARPGRRGVLEASRQEVEEQERACRHTLPSEMKQTRTRMMAVVVAPRLLSRWLVLLRHRIIFL
jgi:hypothetical protein